MSEDLMAVDTGANDAATTPRDVSARPAVWRRLLRSRVMSITALLVVLTAVFSITQPTFLSYDNLMLLLISASIAKIKV